MNSPPADRVECPPDAVIRSTGQLWKLVLSGIVLPFPLVALSLRFLRRIGPAQSTAEVVVSLGALVLGAMLIAGLLISVRCPGCGARWMRRVFGSSEGSLAIAELLNARQCPDCGFPSSISTATGTSR
jgi:hypothetical protein